jgi:hypothetical protein
MSMSYVTTDKKGMKQLLVQCQNALAIWYNGYKPTVLPQIHQESDECQIQNQPIRSLRSEQDCQWHTNDNMLLCGWLQIESPQQ